MDMVAASVPRRMSEDQFNEFWDRMRSEEDKVYVPARSWADLVLDSDTGANAIVFSSGMGDGGYPCYYGHDSEGQLVTILTDFGLLETDEDMEAVNRRRQWWKFW